MENSTNSWRSARNICIVTTLAKLGHFPTKTTEKEAWFLSPLRSETQASFNVSLHKNLWYDFGNGQGGNIIDLIMILNNCSFRKALNYLNSETISSFCPPDSKKLIQEPKLIIRRVTDISTPGLLHYLKERRIPYTIANKYCKEVTYELYGKRFYSIGLKNNLGGWELRNKYCKNSSSPKYYTFLSQSSSILIITEGMFDFLSLVVFDRALVQQSDCIVLNSLSFIDKIEKFLLRYKSVYLYLDNDVAGKKTTGYLLTYYSHITDCSAGYIGYKDLNEKLRYEKA
jgi:5S rRNA maturation endonuclease (ribonuclease M5)